MRLALWRVLVFVAIAIAGCGGASTGGDLGVLIPHNDAVGNLDPALPDDVPRDGVGTDLPDGVEDDRGTGPDSWDLPATDLAGDLADPGGDAAQDATGDGTIPNDDASGIDAGHDLEADAAGDPGIDVPGDPGTDPGEDPGQDLPEDPGFDPGKDVPPAEPGLAIAHAIYPHTSSELFVWDGSMTPPLKVGNFAFPSDGLDHTMTDMAIDYDGRLYGVTFGGLYHCMADTAKCTNLASLGEQFNGMTVVPAGTIQPSAETLVAISNAGGWYRVDVSASKAVLTHQGDYGTGYTSAGDAYSIVGAGTWAAVNHGTGGTLLVAVDPVTGAVQQELGAIPGENIFGLAGWYAGKVFAFDSSGVIYQGDTTSAATFKPFLTTTHAWYGAAVSTRDPH